MIACQCNAVTDRAVVHAIAAGATDLDSIGQMCGAGTTCGGCHSTLATLLAATRAVDAAFGEVGVPVAAAAGRRAREAARG